MVNYKLYYFPVRNLAEPIRMLFHYHGTKFEDVRFQLNEWPEHKHGKVFFRDGHSDNEFPHGKLPVLDVDGKKLSESQAIFRYVATKFGLAGKGEWEQARVDEILDFQKTVYGAFGPYLYLMAGFREGDKDAVRRDFLVAAEKYLPIFAKLLEQSPNGFFVPSGPTVADFTVADFLHTTMGFEPGVMKKYPELEKFIAKVYSLPKLKMYIETRPKADL